MNLLVTATVLVFVNLMILTTDCRQVNTNRQERRGESERQRPITEEVLTPPITGQTIRLSSGDGANYTAGGLEVYLRDRWGVVCDDKWDIHNAHVACRQLGFDRLASSAVGESFFGSGEWRSSDIIMDDVQCDGTEASLQECKSSHHSNCDTQELAGVVCQPYQGCPSDWIAGPYGCYKLLSTKVTRRKHGFNKCKRQGGHIVNIENEAENHFLANTFSTLTEGPVLTGGYKDDTGHWLWEKVSRSDTEGHHSETSSNTVQAPIEYFKWFPGWGTEGTNSEPSDGNKERCLFLSNSYVSDQSDGQQMDTGYLWWQDDICTSTRQRLIGGFHVLCEMPKDISETEIGCYTGRGVDYRGLASRTEDEEECLPWTLSSEINPRSHPDAGLENNYCRNPDNDERPWCWITEDGDFGHCDIPFCPDDHEPLHKDTQPKCPADEFYCSSDRRCISHWWRCDHEYDCSYKEDEDGCDYKVNLFKKMPWKRIPKQHIRETYIGTTNETCAVHCLNREKYVCRSFSYNPTSRECNLSDQNADTIQILASIRTDYYELIPQTGDCTGKFNCTNGWCIEESLVCNGKNDCVDFSDETGCDVHGPVEVRLMNGDGDSGRVEVKYMGEWGLICDDNWDDDDATVVCRMLGHTTGVPQAKLYSMFGAGDGDFLLDEVNCNGTETSLDQCGHNGWRVNDCYSWEVAGVDCNVPKVVTVQLVDGEFPYEGRVELIIDGIRGTVCDDDWDDIDASVVCRGLGYKDGIAVMNAHFGEGSGAILMDDVKCSGDEESLGQCSSLGPTTQNCVHSEDAGVICNPFPDVCTNEMFSCGTADSCVEKQKVCDGSCNCESCLDETDCDTHIELVDGPEEGEGRVEIVRNGIRGTVCDDLWDDADALVVCRSLGYRDGIALIEAHYGEGEGLIWFDNVECDGTEMDLKDCRHISSASNNCDHSEDAGVICQNRIDDLSVELIGGDGTYGYVLVTRNGERGTVCDDSWGNEDATVVCRMLGLGGGLAYKEAYFGQGDDDLQIILDDVHCTGAESSLADCRHREWGQNNCDHSEDAGVRCDSSDRSQTESTTVTTTTTTLSKQSTTIPASTRSSTRRRATSRPSVSTTAQPTEEASSDSEDCLRDTEQYRGRHSRTKTGLKCQAWSLNTPHQHKHHTDTSFPDATVEDASNFCRSPDGDVRQWCYTVDRNVRWEYCEIPYCDENCYRAAANYRGRVSQTRSGKQCQAWTSNSPHRHRDHDDTLFPDGSEAAAKNYCRSPDGDPVPWCYTMDKQSRAEYCDIPRCPSIGFDFNLECGRRPLSPVRNRRETTGEEEIIDSTEDIDRFLYMKRGRIVGGHTATYGMFPWQVGVRKQLSPYYGVADQRWCGATIISEYWVLSAAHCFRELNRAQIILRTGDHNNEVTDEYEEMFEVEVILPHEDYTVTNAFNHDLALLRIRPKQGRGIIFNDYVQPACLPDQSTEYTPGQKCFISGWGSVGRDYPNMLKAASVPLIDDRTCKRLYGKGEISEQMLCAGYVVGGVDTCAGDSGGPLVCRINGRFTVMGVTSWGGGCANANAPGVYAKVASMLPWIERTLRNY